MEIALGRVIRRLRLSHRMTQRELAWRLRVSVQAVSKWECGRSYPDLALLPSIAHVFSVSLDELFAEGDTDL